MTERIKAWRTFIREGRHHTYRKNETYPYPEYFESRQTSHMERVTQAFCDLLQKETPLVLDDEKILLWRTVKNLPDLLSEAEWDTVRQSSFIHERGYVSNVSPGYASVLSRGLLDVRSEAEEKRALASERDQTMFYDCVLRSIDAIMDLCSRYGTAAEKAGNREAAGILSRVPAHSARTFREALQFLRILHYSLWCEGSYHNTLGRFDQYMYPYLQADLEAGRIDEEDAIELMEEFFLSLNRDSDLYPGIQQGDNGQSMMLGGVDREGNPCYNLLSDLCLRASQELKLIDPKINLRVDKNTPLAVYEKGTLLTREGLGFPQYSNDDIVIPGLTAKGYDLADARDYTVAACWEFIIPKYGMDIPNIGAVNFPGLLTESILEDLPEMDSYEGFFGCYSRRIEKCCWELCEETRTVYMLPAPFLSVMMDGCMEKGRDISLGCKYNNYGFHGVGISTDVDSLIVIKQEIFERKTMSAADASRLIEQGGTDDEAFTKLRYTAPKFGNGDQTVDQIATDLIEAFADAVEPLRNDRGGCVRAGTGSAMYYLWYADHVGNALSGHRKGEGFSANYAPELFVRNNGPLSVIRSFTKPRLWRVPNGGPLTMEFHAKIFEDEESLQKVAALVRAFVQSGGHQLQLNSVSREILLDAQKHPEQYKNLIVRIWGWSAYFTELDVEYQNHVIARQEFTT